MTNRLNKNCKTQIACIVGGRKKGRKGSGGLVSTHIYISREMFCIYVGLSVAPVVRAKYKWRIRVIKCSVFSFVPSCLPAHRILVTIAVPAALLDDAMMG